ncbi:hypothetical protein IscW_ISCW019326 [Ixodes scapularis]|uniref:Uncharacterized protein n=1 Tax=Ixodes scapularis TaxID=6945 RepID=B7PTB5_IXOSC|nr:hypothetical protein IscW_ISCW019326 [Ixodes scapularis]|eukprot:XP_002404104.1 hypothetical protein IscW_ISCW019326 [Ixodes scapularis]
MARSTTAAPDAKHPQDDEADVCLGNLGAENEQIVTNVLSYFKEEATRSRLLCPLKRVCRRTAQATGLSKSAVVGALGDRGPSLTPELESDDAAGLHRLAGDAAGLCALRRQILFHCANYGKPPSLRVVCDMIREQCNASCTRSAAVTLLDRLGFRLRRLPGSNARLLLEDSQQSAFGVGKSETAANMISPGAATCWALLVATLPRATKVCQLKAQAMGPSKSNAVATPGGCGICALRRQILFYHDKYGESNRCSVCATLYESGARHPA